MRKIDVAPSYGGSYGDGKLKPYAGTLISIERDEKVRIMRERDYHLLMRVVRAADKWRSNDDGKEFELVDAVDALNAKAKR